ncbi:DNA sulfur modification protein DndD [Nitrosomonas ureae]|uniref:DNA sulfur modification protein DndD n=1 Tax=Nitrosomonas ureae TaxID=44577 RepID=A0A2T5ITR5_9PROT|nr:DNA sulfur modification protein DndD [Nitrosomonas ureae]PTQ87266.1 DNA sulfur modification protein DndD [Nitrosomonas ureae]
MIFKTLTLHNIFSYYGIRTFDLTPSANRHGNIVVIMGRNGFGKTSLLNSVKLLFGGIEELRKTVQRDRVLTHNKSYIRGDNKDWWGILNHRARIHGDLKCSVSAILLDEDNREIEIERSWDLHNENYESQLSVKAPRIAHLTDKAADKYISGLLPKDYIPFFFFDAEDIGYLAEANRNQVIEKMEQLLNIRPVENLKECLKELRRRIESKYIAKDVHQRLQEAENRKKLLAIQRDELQYQQQTLNSDLEALEDELRETRQKIRLLGGQGIIENNAKLEATKAIELANLEAALIALSEALGRDAFLRLNAKLIQKSLSKVERCAHSQQGATAEMLQSLRESLKAVFTTPPYPEHRLDDSQVVFYQKRITKLFDSRDVDDDEKKPFELDSGRARKLLTVLAAYSPQHHPEAILRDELSRALRADHKITEIDKTLQEVTQLSDESKQQFQLLREKETRLQDEFLKLKDHERKILHELSIIDRKIKPLDEETNKLRNQARQSEQGRARLDVLENMQKLLEAYKQTLKEQQRGALEKHFNSHMKSLLDSNRLIAKTKIDEFFQLHFLDVTGNPVAMSSISAGMKQLSATALLWALKDACGKQLPVIFDSPLGRIDRQHQDNLLTRYYPHAARQVILLPTDSELDERKRRLLEPHIYREFHLHNPDGENTEIELITPIKEPHHG